MNQETAFLETYKKTLTGEIKSLPASFLSESAKRDLKMTAVVKYVVEQEGWTPEEARRKISGETIEKYKLKRFVKYIPKPTDVVEGEFGYIVEYAFPELEEEPTEERAVAVYKKVLKGEVKRFPKNFFYDERDGKGKKRVKACVKFLLQEKMQMEDDEIEDIFQDNKCADILRANSLSCLLSTIYSSRYDLYEDCFGKEG